MREFGLIRANVDGFEDPTNKFVMRSVSHMLGMSLSIQSAATEHLLSHGLCRCDPKRLGGSEGLRLTLWVHSALRLLECSALARDIGAENSPRM